MKRIILILIGMFSVLSAQSQSSTYKFSKKINLNGDGKWDYMKVDNTMKRLYVSHADRVHVIDLKNDLPIAEWTGFNNVHGISNSQRKVYIANTGDNNVVIYDAVKLEKLATVELKDGLKPDCILFDEYSQQAFVFCGKSHNVYIIDGISNQVVSVIDLEGKPEFACTDGSGHIYNNLEDKSEVAVIDAKAYKIVTKYSLGEGKSPTGIAIDVKNDRLMVACEESKTMVVLSKSTGKIIASVPIGGRTDGLIYVKGLIVTSNGEGSATIIKQDTPEKYSVIQTLKTKLGLKTIAVDETTNRFFISGAELQENEKTPVPSTFGVFIFSNK